MVEWTNLQRQVLFDEADARDGHAQGRRRRPPAGGGEFIRRRRAGRVGPAPRERGSVGRRRTATDLARGTWPARRRRHGSDLILDGTDNVETRYLLNDVSVKHGIPWVYGACVGTEGRVMASGRGKRPACGASSPSRRGRGSCRPATRPACSGRRRRSSRRSRRRRRIRLLVDRDGAPRRRQLLSLRRLEGRFHSTPLDGAPRPDCRDLRPAGVRFLDPTPGVGPSASAAATPIQIRPAAARARRSISSRRRAAQPSGDRRADPAPAPVPDA